MVKGFEMSVRAPLATLSRGLGIEPPVSGRSAAPAGDAAHPGRRVLTLIHAIGC